MAHFSVKFHEYNDAFSVKFTEPSYFNVSFGNIVYSITDTIERYAGEYEVIPAVNEQQLPTSKKYLENDITIKAIPYYDTTNQAGGNTVYIGGYI